MNRDLGPRDSYLGIALGTAVYDVTEQHVGIVSHILAVEELDVFDGLVVATVTDPVAHRFADADQVGEIYERGVLLKVTWSELPVPSESPAALEVGADDMERENAGGKLEDRLHRAWNLISGKGNG
jgi:hypothetical protein